jgi:hypothetical protein
MADPYLDEPDLHAHRRGRHPALLVLYALVSVAVLGLALAGIAAVVRMASDARDERAREEAAVLACDEARPTSDGDTRNLCLYPDRPDRQPDDHEAELGAPVRLAGVTARLDDGFMHQLVLADQLTLRVTIHNRDDRPKTFGSTDWKVIDADGTPVNPTRSERDDALGTGELAPGETVTGTIAYDLPAGTYYVVYRPEAINQARGIWRIEVPEPE